MYNQYLQQVIDRGLDMLRSGNVTQDMFNVWLDWSQTVLRLIVKNPKINSDWKSPVCVTPEAQVPLTLESKFRMTPIKS